MQNSAIMDVIIRELETTMFLPFIFPLLNFTRLLSLFSAYLLILKDKSSGFLN